jgi:hypothetical protein
MSSVGIQKPQKHQIDDVGRSSSHTTQDYKKQRGLCHMDDTLLAWEHL